MQEESIDTLKLGYTLYDKGGGFLGNSFFTSGNLISFITLSGEKASTYSHLIGDAKPPKEWILYLLKLFRPHSYKATLCIPPEKFLPGGLVVADIGMVGGIYLDTSDKCNSIRLHTRESFIKAVSLVGKKLGRTPVQSDSQDFKVIGDDSTLSYKFVEREVKTKDEHLLSFPEIKEVLSDFS